MTKICTQTCDKAISLNSYRGMDNVFYTDSDLKPWCRCMWRYWLSSVWTDRPSFRKSVDETFCKRKDHPHAVSVCKSREEEVRGQRDAPPAAPQLILFKRPASEVQRKQHVHCEVICFFQLTLYSSLQLFRETPTRLDSKVNMMSLHVQRGSNWSGFCHFLL